MSGGIVVEIPTGLIPCPVGVPVALWKVLSVSYNPSQLYAIKYVSEIAHNNSNNDKNKNSNNDNNNINKDSANYSNNHNNDENIDSSNNSDKNINKVTDTGTGQDTRISLIQVQSCVVPYRNVLRIRSS